MLAHDRQKKEQQRLVIEQAIQKKTQESMQKAETELEQLIKQRMQEEEKLRQIREKMKEEEIDRKRKREA